MAYEELKKLYNRYHNELLNNRLVGLFHFSMYSLILLDK